LNLLRQICKLIPEHHSWWLMCGGHAFLGRDLTLEIGDMKLCDGTALATSQWTFQNHVPVNQQSSTLPESR